MFFSSLDFQLEGNFGKIMTFYQADKARKGLLPRA
jgi:hypothetical protein